MKRAWLIAALVLAGLGTSLAGVELYLKDGQVLKGVDVRREDGNYLLTLAGGDVVPVPQQLVDRVGLTEDRPRQLDGPPVGSTPSDSVQIDGPPVRSTPSDPLQIDGPPIKAPRTSEQLGVLGEPSKFQQGVFDPNWHPESDWQDDPTDVTRNDFAPSQWSESIIDPSWHPESDWQDDPTDTKRNDFAPSEFQKGIVDPNWVPQDGFKKKSSWG